MNEHKLAQVINVVWAREGEDFFNGLQHIYKSVLRCSPLVVMAGGAHLPLTHQRTPLPAFSPLRMPSLRILHLL